MNKKEIDEILKELEIHDILSVSEDIYLLDYIKSLQQENKKLKDNWNKLKEWIIGEKMEFYNIKNCLFINYNDLFWKMQELESGASNE